MIDAATGAMDGFALVSDALARATAAVTLARDATPRSTVDDRAAWPGARLEKNLYGRVRPLAPESRPEMEKDPRGGSS